MNTVKQDSQPSIMDAANTALKENSGVKTEHIEGTPYAVRGKEKEWIVCWGKFPISPIMPTFEAAKALIDDKDWSLLHNMCSIIAHSVYNEGLANLVANVEQVITQKQKQNG